MLMMTLPSIVDAFINALCDVTIVMQAHEQLGAATNFDDLIKFGDRR